MSWTSIDRYVKGKVEVYRASTLLYTLMPNDYLKSIEIVSSPVKAFFGYAMSQQTTITFIDKLAELAILEGDIVRPYIGIEDNGTITYIQKPDFIIGKVDRKQNGIDLIVEGYDLIEKAKEYKPSSLAINLPCNLEQYFNAVCAVLGCQGNYGGLINFTITELPNYDDNNTLRDILNDLAGACGCICYMSGTVATMKPLTASNPHTISKADYFSLTTGTPLTLTSVISTNPLGDNVESGSGIPQILSDNGFLVNRTDRGTILDSLREAVYGLTVVPYELEWRGNPNVELGDCIELESKNGTITTFYLSESMSYSGGLKASSNFDFTERDALHTNSSTIGEKLNETIAKVDKVNQTIELRVSEAIENDSTVAELKLSVGQIESSVVELEGEVETAKSEMTQTATELTSRVETAEGNASTALQTANSFETRISDAEDNASTAIQTANSFSTRITDAEGNINSIEQSLEGVAYTSSLANGTTTINGGCITTGTIDASKAKISNLSVYNANIVSLDADKITVAGKTLGDGSYLSNIYSNYGSIGRLGTMTLTLNSNSPDEGLPVYLTCAGVQLYGGSLVSWSDILSGGQSGQAVFG